MMNHFNNSMIKSTLRIIACGLCIINGNIFFLAWGLLCAEALGVLEEVVDKRPE